MLILLAYPNYDFDDLSFMGGENNVGDIERGYLVMIMLVMPLNMVGKG